MVPGIRGRIGCAWCRRSSAIGYRQCRHDVILRLAAGDCVWYGNRSGRHGWSLGRLLQPFAGAILFGVTGLLLVTRPLISAEVVTAVMAIFFIIGGLFQLIGSLAIALPGWGWQAADGNHHVCPGPARSGAMAGLRTMGDRSFRGDRFDLLRPRVDCAGTRIACELKRANEIRT